MVRTLFKPNNHSNPRISPQNVLAHAFGLPLHTISREFGLLALESHANNYGSADPSSPTGNFALFDQTSYPYFFKVFRKGTSRDRAELMLAASLFCTQYGVLTPLPHSHPKGGFLATLDVGGEERHAAIYRFVEATSYFSGTFGQIGEVANGLALLHRALSHFPLHETARAQKTVLGFSPDLGLLDATLARHSDVFVELIRAEESFIREETARIQGNQSSLESLTQSLVHRDLHPHNMLFAGDGLIAILDFEQLCFSELLRCIAFTVHRAVRQHVVHTEVQEGELSEDRVRELVHAATREFLGVYASSNTVIRDELALLPDMIALEHLARVYIILDLYLNKPNKGPQACAEEMQKQLNSVREAAYFAGV